MNVLLRSSSVLALLAAALAASASPTITLLAPDATVVRPASGSVVYSFLGSVVADPGYTITSQTLNYPGLTASGPYLPSSFGGAQGQASFAGALFTVTVASTDALGLYAFNSGNSNGRSNYQAGDGLGTSPFVPFSVNVVSANPTPEPSALAALGLGAAAFVRRRRKA